MSRPFHTRLSSLVLSVLFFSFGVTGCISQMQNGGASPAAKTNQAQDPTDMTQRVLEIDTEIDKEHENISEHRSLINMTYLDLWQIEKGGPATSRGGISQNGPVDVEHEIIRLQGDIAAIEKDITNRKRRIKNLTNEKARILDQKAKACFPGETLVLTDQGLLKPIRNVTTGDMIMTFDVGSQTDIPKRVLSTYESENNHYYLINNAIRTTAFERLLTTKGWRKVIQLKVGDKVHTDQGLTNIHSIVVKREVQTVHNLQVQDSHTFYVMDDGEKRYLVHNTGGGGRQK